MRQTKKALFFFPFELEIHNVIISSKSLLLMIVDLEKVIAAETLNDME
jgi:hypothetical protein